MALPSEGRQRKSKAFQPFKPANFAAYCGAYPVAVVCEVECRLRDHAYLAAVLGEPIGEGGVGEEEHRVALAAAACVAHAVERLGREATQELVSRCAAVWVREE